MNRPDERGLVAGAEALLFGTLVLVTGTMVISAAWATITTRAALDDAAREYLRAYTEADSPSAAEASGRAAVRTSIAGAGLDPGRVTFVEPDASRFGPCAEAAVELHLDRAGIRLPFVRAFGTVHIEVRHVELVDPLREITPGDRHDVEATPCGG